MSELDSRRTRSAEPSSMARGERLGPFRLIRELGRGGQGRVYLARDSRFDRQVALKLLFPIGSADGELRERFRREALVAGQLATRGIPAVHEVGEVDGILFIAMEYIAGETLASKLAQARQAASAPGLARTLDRSASDVRARIIENVARTVHRAHEQGIVHRDLKPANLVIDPQGLPVVLDFGLAALREDPLRGLTRFDQLLGTPAYMAPEQIDSLYGAVGVATDVFALGAILYECLTLRRPFEAPTREELYRLILEEETVSPRQHDPEIDRDLAAIVSTALAKEPWRRYSSALALAEDLESWRRQEPVRARLPSRVYRLRRWVSRNPKLAAAGGGLALSLALGLILSLHSLAAIHRAVEEEQFLVDELSLPILEHRADEELWPALPSQVAAMDGWLSEAEALYDRLPRYAWQLERLREADPDEGPGAQYSRSGDPEPLRTRDRLIAFTDRLARLPERIHEVRRRREEAAALEGRTITSHLAEWEAAIEDIARSPHYGGLRIEPQVGLIPLGPDPDSGLHEFAHVQSGEVAVRAHVSGRLRMEEDSAIVFVLIPGGRFTMGAVPPRPDSPLGLPNVDPWALPNEAPLQIVELEPLFLSKYEMTQGQCLRLTGENPSSHGPDTSNPALRRMLAHPVESISWQMAQRLLDRYGLLLPTEAQWEYAARAGSATVWSTGDSVETLAGFVNIADRQSALTGSIPSLAKGVVIYNAGWPDLDDGHAVHAPVGSFRPNAFGLHDLHGNVSELVRDVYASYSAPVRAADGERRVEERPLRIARGGHYGLPASAVRSAARHQIPPESRYPVGIRAARALMRSAAAR